jgi:menaquinone-dependent protoporphyrinogen oxidase
MTDAKQKVLVAYATRAGSTAGVAKRVAEVLNRNGFAAQATDIKEAGDTVPYDAVVLGSSIRAGKLMPEVLSFIEKNRADLTAKPLAAFVVCLTMKERDDKSRAVASAYLNPVHMHVTPLSEGLFAGAYDPGKLGFIERTVMKMIKAPSGDFRNWDEIETWAGSLVRLFTIGPVV